MIFNVISTEEGIKSVPFVDVVDVSPLMAVMVLLGTMQSAICHCRPPRPPPILELMSSLMWTLSHFPVPLPLLNFPLPCINLPSNEFSFFLSVSAGMILMPKNHDSNSLIDNHQWTVTIKPLVLKRIDSWIKEPRFTIPGSLEPTRHCRLQFSFSLCRRFCRCCSDFPRRNEGRKEHANDLRGHFCRRNSRFQLSHSLPTALVDKDCWGAAPVREWRKQRCSRNAGQITLRIEGETVIEGDGGGKWNSGDVEQR